MNYQIIPGLKYRPEPSQLTYDAFQLKTERILKVVADFYEIQVEDMKKKTRKRKIVEARRMAMYLLKRYTRMSLKAIIEAFDLTDHTNVIHHLKAMEDLKDVYPQIKIDIQTIENKL